MVFVSLLFPVTISLSRVGLYFKLKDAVFLLFAESTQKKSNTRSFHKEVWTGSNVFLLNVEPKTCVIPSNTIDVEVLFTLTYPAEVNTYNRE